MTQADRETREKPYTEEEISISLTRAKEHLNQSEAGRGKERSSPRVFRKEPTLSTPWFSTSGLQNCERINFCSFKRFGLLVLCYSNPKKLIHTGNNNK